MRERIELRSKASLTNYLTAALQGRSSESGAEAELQAAADIGNGIPLELWDVPEQRQTETRADASTAAPGTVGVNSGTASVRLYLRTVSHHGWVSKCRGSSLELTPAATTTTSLTAGSKAKGAAQEGNGGRLSRCQV